MKTKNIIYIASGTLTLLSIPLLAMLFTDEVNWDLPDFIIMGILLFGTGMVWEFLQSRLKTTRQKLFISLALLFTFLYIWAELAVGIFTNLGS